MTHVTHTRHFTLVEIIVVMLLLATTMALAVPRLNGFVRGHGTEDAARRLWALSQYARDRATTQAVPMALWVDTTGDVVRYGVEPVAGFGETAEPLIYVLPDHLELTALETVGTTGRVAASAPVGGRLSLVWWPDGSTASTNAAAWRLSDTATPGDDWYLVRQSPRYTYTLSREWTP